MSNELEKFVQHNRAAFDGQEPNPAVLQRLQEQMKGAQKKKGIIVSFQTIRWAAACVVVLAGLGLFYLAQPNGAGIQATAPQQQVKQVPGAVAQATEPVKNEPASSGSELPANPVKLAAQSDNTYEQQLLARKQALFAKLNDMASPGSRVAAAGEAYKLKTADKEIVDALVHSMTNDPNTNVRLAALDALTRFHRESYVKQQLVKALKKQNDPMVQIPLIQLLTKMRQTAILDQLEKLVKDDNTMDAVKDNAYSGILLLKS